MKFQARGAGWRLILDLQSQKPVKIVADPLNFDNFKGSYVLKSQSMPNYSIKVNGEVRSVEVSADTPLLWVLRDHLNLPGTKYGCGIALCGTCTVHMNGNPVRSCVLPIGQLRDAEITTIEGLSEDGSHPVQKAWKAVDVPQCGYCQAGQIMSAAALLEQNPNPSDTEIREAMNGNICRCASYQRISEAVALAARDSHS